MNVSSDDLYAALIADAEREPSNWNYQGREVDTWIQYGEWCL